MINSGVYEIYNSVNGKRYIGSTVNFDRRWREHQRRLNTGSHRNRILILSWNKHGGGEFKFNKILLCSRENLLMYEQLAIDAIKPEYNLSPVAGLPHGSTLTDEHKRKIGEAHKGKKRGPQPLSVRAKISQSNKGKIKSAETRARLSSALMGRTYSAETIRKMSASATGTKRPRSAAHQAAISASQRGKKRGPLSEQTRQKLCISQKLRRQKEKGFES